MSVSVGHAQLHDALKKLRVQWEQTRKQWKDPVAAEFEEKVWLPLEGGAGTTMAAMDRLEQVLGQMRKDCGAEGEGFDLASPSEDSR